MSPTAGVSQLSSTAARSDSIPHFCRRLPCIKGSFLQMRSTRTRNGTAYQRTHDTLRAQIGQIAFIFRGKRMKCSSRVRITVPLTDDQGRDGFAQRLSVPFGFFPHEYDQVSHAAKATQDIHDADREAFKTYFDER
eukprot:2861687-Rhodomonas_salina.1